MVFKYQFGCFGSNLGQNRPKKVQIIPIGLERKIRPFSTWFQSLDMDFAQKLQVFAFKFQFWVKVGSKFVQNWSKMSKKCNYWHKRPNDTILNNSFRHWVWILHKNYKFWSSSTNFGWLGSNLGQNRPQNVQNQPIGLERKIRPFFHIFSVTGYEFCTKITNFCSQDSILGQYWSKISKKFNYIHKWPNDTIFQLSLRHWVWIFYRKFKF